MPSAKRQVARAAGIVVFAFALSRALGLVREATVSRAFGTSAELDAFRAASQVTETLYLLVAGGALGSAFIPTFSDYMARGERRQAWHLASAIANLVTLVTSVLALLTALVAPLLVSTLLAPGFSAEQQTLTAELLRWMLLSIVIFGVSGLLMGVLNAHQHFLLPALAPSMYNLGIIGGALLADSLGIRGLAAGAVVGAALHLLVQLPALRGLGGRYVPSLGLNTPGVRHVGRLIGPRILGLAVTQLNFWVNINLASRLSEGAVSALTFGWRVMLLPQGIFAQAVATAAFPTLADQSARRQRQQMGETLAATLRAIFVLTIPATVGLAVLRRPLIVLLFQGGEFDAQSTDMVSWALLFYALGLVAHSGIEIVARAFYALHDTRTPVLVGGGAMLLNLILSLIFMSVFEWAGWPPLGGLALANSLATTLELLGLLWLIRARLSGLQGSRTLKAMIRSGLASLLMGAALLGLQAALPQRPIPLAVGGVILGAGVYALAAWRLGVEEVRLLLDRARRFLAAA